LPFSDPYCPTGERTLDGRERITGQRNSTFSSESSEESRYPMDRLGFDASCLCFSSCLGLGFTLFNKKYLLVDGGEAIDSSCPWLVKGGYRVSDPDDIGTVRPVGWLMRSQFLHFPLPVVES
jgi:hypothetical protein